jgi:hypothetical protein
MTYENCSLGEVHVQTGGWGFVVTNIHRRPVVWLTYKTKAEAEAAHVLMVKVIEGAAVTPAS